MAVTLPRTLRQPGGTLCFSLAEGVSVRTKKRFARPIAQVIQLARVWLFPSKCPSRKCRNDAITTQHA